MATSVASKTPLDNKVALVIGAGRGIGRAISLGLAEAGAQMAINDINGAAELEGLANEIRTIGQEAKFFEADMSLPEQAAGVIPEVVNEFGRLDILCYNAGICPFSPFLEIDRSSYEKTRAVNLDGAFYSSQAAARQMVAQGEGGKIVFITSVGARIAAPNQAHYNATKAGLEMLGRGMARELGVNGINVNMVGPAAVVTDMSREIWEHPEERAKLPWLVPLNRFGQPEDIAAAVVFLCSNSASFITGASLYVDGGLTTSKK